MQQKKVIIIAVALIAIILVAAGVAAAMLGGDSYASKVEEGYRYLEAGDYNNAILAFRQAMDMDETREDAYYGLYQAYGRSGQLDLAKIALRLGVEKSGSANLITLLSQVEVMDAAQQAQNQSQTQQNADQVDDKNVVAVLNTQLLDLFASATYGDYLMKYTVSGTLGSGEYSMYVSSIGATVIFRDTASQRVIDVGRGVPYSEIRPALIRMDNVTALFGGMSRLSFDTLKGMAGITDAAMDGNTITFTYSGCAVTVMCVEPGVITANSENYLVPSENGGQEKGEYVVVASVKDATTGRPVVDAKVLAYEGNGTFGTPIEGKTDFAGMLTLELVNSGVYTIVIEKNGYIKESFEVFVLSNVYSIQQEFHISPTISGNGIRFVLSWGATPSDLDSYLVGTASDGTAVNINYTNMYVGASNGSPIAELDVDDTTSYGPETITLYDIGGSYEFYVDDFTNSGTISISGATVKIYVGSTLYTTVSIPGGVSDLWHVCVVNNGNITVTNRAY